MYYFEGDKDKITKYKISFEEKELEKIKIEIINNCSTIIHREERTTFGMFGFGKSRFQDRLKYRNYREEKVGIKEYIDGPDEDIYHITYDEYIYPKLIELIDKLIKGDISVIEEIFNDDKIEKPISYEEKIKKVSLELDKIDNLNIKEKRNKLNELEKVIKEAKLNENRKSIIYYYEEVKKIVIFNKEDEISLEEVERVRNFFGENNIKLSYVKPITRKKTKEL